MGLSVAITGGIACGKSAFAGCLRRLGVEVLEADDVVHTLEAPGGAAVELIRRRFGEGVIAADGGVDRAKLAEQVFADAKAREELNHVLHPMVRQIVNAWRDRQAGVTMSAVVIPLLFEAGWECDWDVVICVSSDTQAQVDRLMRFRGLSAEQARQRLDAQFPTAEKTARAHLTVENNAGTEWLAEEAGRIYRLLMERSEDEYRT
ncbi:MAG: dephospho-CoA kinase [Kiritimatiellaeota bacterium]|nr:dephospho-CoA kinase [Kiritimatiellota bacterium]